MNRAPLLISSRNPKKIKEIKTLLSPYFEVSDLSQYPDFPEVEETKNTFSGNAGLKAIEISRHFHGYVIADDSGLCVKVLNNKPGVYSARYAGKDATDKENNAKLLEDLSFFKDTRPWFASFNCCIVLAQGGEKVAEFNGVVEGKITHQEFGEGGFGYDPLFIPKGHKQTFAELSPEKKNKMSHRANALSQFVQWCENNL